MKKIYICLILIASVFIGTARADSLSVQPSLLNLTVPVSQFNTRQITVKNSGGTRLKIRSGCNSDWIWVHPENFELSKGMKQEVTAGFFFPAPEKKGEIIFQADGETVKVEVVITESTEAPETTKMSPERKEIQKLRKEVVRLNKELDKLKSYKEKLADYEAQIKVLQNKVFELQAAKKKTCEELRSLHTALTDKLEKEIRADLIQVTWSSDARLLIIVPSVFGSGQIYPNERGSELLGKIGEIFKNHAGDNLIEVRCHADILPVSERMREKGITSNWELSTLRASKIAQILQYRSKIEGKNLLVSGCAFYRPIYDNRILEGRKKNRRVEIFVLVP